MGVSALTAAKRLCQLSEWSLSNLALQKMLYVAHMVHMGRTDGDLLIDGEEFEAWDYGPVLPSVYHQAKAFGSGAVKNVFHSQPDRLDDDFDETLVDTYKALADKKPSELVAIAHWKDGAWAKHYESNKRGIVIPNEDVLEEYRARLE